MNRRVGVQCRNVPESPPAYKEIKLALYDVKSGVDHLHDDLFEIVSPLTLGVEQLYLKAHPTLCVAVSPRGGVEEVLVFVIEFRCGDQVVAQQRVVRASVGCLYDPLSFWAKSPPFPQAEGVKGPSKGRKGGKSSFFRDHTLFMAASARSAMINSCNS